VAYAASDGLLGLLHPILQAAIAGCLLLVLVLGTHRLIQRGPSRMTRAALVTALLIVAVAVFASQFH
jgi:hypothetical protein